MLLGELWDGAKWTAFRYARGTQSVKTRGRLSLLREFLVKNGRSLKRAANGCSDGLRQLRGLFVQPTGAEALHPPLGETARRTRWRRRLDGYLALAGGAGGGESALEMKA